MPSAWPIAPGAPRPAPRSGARLAGSGVQSSRLHPRSNAGCRAVFAPATASPASLAAFIADNCRLIPVATAPGLANEFPPMISHNIHHSRTVLPRQFGSRRNESTDLGIGPLDSPLWYDYLRRCSRVAGGVRPICRRTASGPLSDSGLAAPGRRGFRGRHRLAGSVMKFRPRTFFHGRILRNPIGHP